MGIDTTRERHEHEVAVWRREQLIRSGFSRRMASQLAQETPYDVHALIELVERGCPPPTAARILAPLERRVAE